MLARGIGLEGGARLLQEPCGAGHREKGQLQQRQRVNNLRALERELERDRGAARVADDMGARTPRWARSAAASAAWSAMLHRRRCVRAARPAALVVRDQPIAGGQAGSDRSGRKPSATTGLMSSTGSPYPVTSYSKSTPFTRACCIVLLAYSFLH